MYQLNKDDLTFKGQEDVLNKIDTLEKTTLFYRLKLLLEMEIEIPLLGIVIACICFIAITNFQIEKESIIIPDFPIVVIESGGQYEIY